MACRVQRKLSRNDESRNNRAGADELSYILQGHLGISVVRKDAALITITGRRSQNRP
jgi:hypothetical protein